MKLYRLHVLRAWAAMAVVLFHLGGALAAPKYFNLEWTAFLTGFGTHGVLVFFVLSGFIIHHVHARDIGEPDRLGRYLWRRFIRIFPVYWTVLAMVWAFAIATGIGRDGMPEDILIILKTILLLPQDKAVVGGTGAPVVIVAWSLQYELLFYALFGLAILHPWLGMAMAGLLVTANVAMNLMGNPGMFPGYLDPLHLVSFGLGLLASWAHGRGCFDKTARFLVPTAIALAGCAWALQSTLSFLAHEERPIFKADLPYLLLACLAALLIGAMATLDRLFPAAPPKWMIWLGDCSYLLYLVHFPVISAACKIGVSLGLPQTAGAAIASILALGGSILLAAILREAVEKPVLAWGRRA